MQKQGGEVVDLVQKTFCEFTIADDESHFQGSRASLVCDLPLAAFSKQIDRKTRIHTQGLSPENRDCPRKTHPQSMHTDLGTVPEFSPSFLLEGKPHRSKEVKIVGLSDVAWDSTQCVSIAANSQAARSPALQ